MNLDQQIFKTLCMHCTRPLPVSVGQARRSEEVSCSNCGVQTKICADQFKREIHQMENAYSDFQRQMHNLS